MIHRHPNVFSDTVIKTAEEQTVNWEKMKKKEDTNRSVIDGVPKQLPALLKAHRTQQKAATVGFDWQKVEQVWEKVEEELNELKNAIEEKNPKNIEDEFGDLLFTMVNLSRFIKVNPEDALRKSVEKFSTRFRRMEEEVENSNQSFENISLNEMDKIWEKIKSELR